MLTAFRRCFGWSHGASAVFAGTVVLGYLPSFWLGTIDLGQVRWKWCLLFGVVYALLGTLDYTYCRLHLGLLRRAAYLGAQGGLLGGILVTSRLSGQVPVCIFPLVAVMMVLLGPAAAAGGLVLLFAGVGMLERHFYPGNLLPFMSGLLPAFAFVALFTRIAVREKIARDRAESLTAEVERLAVIQERNRLAGEIHDSLGHFLTTIHVQLEGARAIHAVDPLGALDAVAKAQDLARDALVEVRRSVGALQADGTPPPLAARLRDLAAATDGWGAAVALEVLGPPRVLAREAENALYRVTQEGLTNVRKHSHARNARVTLDYRDPAWVVVRLSDDGRGATAGSPGCGLAGLRERIAAQGGRMVAAGAPGGGFHLQAELPA
jgi:signal transduction histidine kinase